MIRPHPQLRGAAAIAFATSMLLFACGGSDGELTDPSLVGTGDGLLRGSVDAAGQRSFRGIPYAAAPVGPLRWKPPQPPAGWGGVRAATAFGSPCTQPIRDATGAPAVLGSEDCLFLNVDAPPSTGAALPVLVFIHGGASRNGAGSDFDASALSAKGHLVVVTLNFRLGVFGHLAHAELGKEAVDGASGQYALMDQWLALAWVQRNIARFGGNPEKVTLMGESSGAGSVCNHLASPAAAGLFHRAVMHSGACASAATSLPRGEAEAAGATFASNVGCAGPGALACLRSASAAVLASAPATARVGASTGWAPAVGGTTLPMSSADAMRSGTFLKMPVLLGSNRDEFRLFVALQELAQGAPVSAAQYTGLVNGSFGAGAAAVLGQYPVAAFGAPNLVQAALFTDFVYACPTNTTAGLFSATVPTWAYEFDDPSAPTQVPAPFIAQGAYHSAELLYLFRQPMSAFGFGPVAALNATQQALADRMIGYWAAFATSGDPNGAGAPTWPSHAAASAPVQRLAPSAIAASAGFGIEHRCVFWAGFGV